MKLRDEAFFPCPAQTSRSVGDDDNFRASTRIRSFATPPQRMT